MATDTATLTCFAATWVYTKQLVAANASNIAQSQTPTANTPFNLNGTTAGVLDTGRRVLITAGSEAAPRSVTITGLNSAGVVISETIAIPASSAGTYQSVRDYLVVTSIVSSTTFTNAVTVGTSGVGSTTPMLPAHLQAVFNLAVQVTVGGTGGTTVNIETTRDVPYAAPQPYVNGYPFSPPLCQWDVWPTLGNITTEVLSDIDSPVTAARATIIAGTDLVTIRFTPLGLRT